MDNYNKIHSTLDNYEFQLRHSPAREHPRQKALIHSPGVDAVGDEAAASEVSKRITLSRTHIMITTGPAASPFSTARDASTFYRNRH